MQRTLGFAVALLLAIPLAACVIQPGGMPPAAPAKPAANQTEPQPIRYRTGKVVLGLNERQNLLTIFDLGGRAASDVIWRSSNDEVASIDDKGMVEGLAPGKAVLYATAKKGPAEATVDVLVVMERNVISLQVHPQTPVLRVGETLKLNASVQLANGTTNGNVYWSSGDDTIATVNAASGEVVAQKEGRVSIIAAYAGNTDYTGQAELTVSNGTPATATSPEPAGSQ